ncbi:hypothetical protein M1615_00265, partial [Patescibacteria group bacterium]|nr:hypothetical protein [Patescibacteria group bacterium]
MIRIIHGDNLVFSRNFFLDKKNKENGVLFAGKEVFLMDIIQAFEGKSLFFETKNIFIEDFFSKRKPDDEYKKIIDYLKNNEEKISVT